MSTSKGKLIQFRICSQCNRLDLYVNCPACNILTNKKITSFIYFNEHSSLAEFFLKKGKKVDIIQNL